MSKNINIKRVAFYLLLVGFIGMFSACEIKEVQFKSIENVKVLKFDENGVEVEMTVKINNPNNLKFKVNTSDLHLFVNGNDFGKVKFKDKIKIASNTEKSYTFVICSGYNMALNGGIGGVMSLLKSGKIAMNLKGNLKVKSWGLSKKYPIDFKQNLNPRSFGF